MDITSSSAWIHHLVTEDDGHWWPQLEMPCFNPVPESSDGGGCRERAVKRNSSSSADLHYAAGSAVISFGSLSPPDEQLTGGDFSLVAGSGGAGQRRAGGGIPASAADREHVIAERKRREKLAQSFSSLSSLLPCLKKSDKASVLGEAARYVKQLKEQVKALEEQNSQPAVESGFNISRKNKTSSIDQVANPRSSSSCKDDFDSLLSGNPILEIDARFSEKDILINLQCRSEEGVVLKILEKIQKLHLRIINCNAVPFGKCIMVVTIVAKMNDGFSASTMEVVSMLRQNLQTLA